MISEVFEESFVAAGKMDSGELKNRHSRWTKRTYQGRAYYFHEDTKVYSLTLRAGGVDSEAEEGQEQFEQGFVRAGKSDGGTFKAGENPQSAWAKITYQSRAYYQIIGSKPAVRSLVTPPEGVLEGTTA